MTYELAKKLQQTLPNCNPEIEPMDMRDGTFSPRDHNNKTIGLSELIDACGDKFGGLLKDKTQWMATTPDKADEIKGGDPIRHYYELVATGSTAIEAVSNLWLSLNKKD